jgi:hypothetical protein
LIFKTPNFPGAPGDTLLRDSSETFVTITFPYSLVNTLWGQFYARSGEFLKHTYV